jgi:uncharacterized membrane protein YcgQ (UPF0703/DUF1980 family)
VILATEVASGSEPETKKRGTLLTVWLILMLIGNASTFIAYFLGGSLLFPIIPSWAIYSLGALAGFNILLIIRLFRWKKWAFFALVGTTAMAFAINTILIGLPASLLGLIGIVILYAVLRPKWNLLQ